MSLFGCHDFEENNHFLKIVSEDKKTLVVFFGQYANICVFHICMCMVVCVVIITNEA